MKMGRPHVLAIPYPAQGHVLPLMELAQCMANSGIRVTFVNTEFNHRRIVKALPDNESISELIELASIPDGMELWEDRNDLGKLTEAMLRVMPEKLEALVEEINSGAEEDKIVCVIADYGLSFAFEVAEKFGVKKTAFLPASVALLALALDAPRLVDEGILDCDGTPLKDETIRLSLDMPEIRTVDLAWTRIGDAAAQKICFNSMLKSIESAKHIDRILCNSSRALEPAALKIVSACSPVGPLLASARLGCSAGHFWQEDAACLEWLDEQPSNSTVYAAFGSFTVFDRIQFRELALGLELTNRPFLWVVRNDIIDDSDNAFPDGFLDRVKLRGKIVKWAPQQKVLGHTAIACFISHCGWNSTMEGVGNGVPFLCWPYFADQFLNATYIADCWGVGLAAVKDGSGGVGREEIKRKIERLMGDERYKVRALELQAMAGEDGTSGKNLEEFVEWIKEIKL
ncbi:UDP-glycosyltransferase 83A1-like [Andrographis paniculata]|uniref:UDP-glycosyltransferase 83A1-like n=1 Tax=Andrographis paniculata TaxID=175694 RepID=UPI0021E79028|nr:UDP-glycosyltransferase 83A1-like [Andrographis paniculata]